MSDQRSAPEQNDGALSPQQQGSNARRKFAMLAAHLRSNSIDVLILVMQLLTIALTIGYVVSMKSDLQIFNKILILSVATSALRLHRYLREFTHSRQLLARLITEEACFNLLFPLIFFNVRPSLLIIMPIFFFALHDVCCFALELLILIAPLSWSTRFFFSLLASPVRSTLKAAVLCELLIMPLVVRLAFTGDAGVMTPIIYYHFLAMRYNSRSNPYLRDIFFLLSIKIQYLAARSPPLVSRILLAGFALMRQLRSQM